MSKKLGLLLSSILFVVASFIFSVAPAAAETYTVTMGSDKGALQFIPDKLTINAGDSVDFVMNKMGPHNVLFKGKANKGLSHKKMLNKSGDSYATTFDTPGKYKYFCQPHRGAGMTGTIIVK